LPRALKEFLPAARTAWFYTLIGLLVGGALLVLSHYLKGSLGADSLWAPLAEHLGISFWVAAIAVFFYEWGAHVKKTFQLAEKLAHLLSGKAEERLKDCLEILLGGTNSDQPEDIRNVASNCQALVLAISELKKEQTWAHDRYVRFVSSFLDKFVGQNAESFKNLLAGGRDDYLFKLPSTAASVADQILAEHMNALTGNDRYDVISDLVSWKGDQMEQFQEATARAVSRGRVRVRRVFNLLLHPSVLLDEPERTTGEQCRIILEKHLMASGQSPKRNKQARYEVKALTQSALANSRIKREQIRDAHFGVFFHNKDGVKIRFKVSSSDLSEMHLCSDHERLKESEELFKKVWEAAESLTPDLINEIVEAVEREGQGSAPSA
jgi:hypothetical protein